MKKFFLKTFGCKLNQYESQLIRENLLLAGLKETEQISDSNYLVIASCCVTQDSVKGMRKFVNSVRRKNPGIKVIILGCVVNIYPEESERLQPYLALDNFQKYNLPRIVGRKNTEIRTQITGFKSHTRAFVKIQDGCDNRCSYCCVWMARGKPHSRKPDEILEEITVLVQAGYREIVLTGLCLGNYGREINSSLVELLRKIEKLDMDMEFRIRISSIEPQDVNAELIEFLTTSTRIVPHLHIPLQSGSDRILTAMNRKYNCDYFRSIIQRLKKANEKFQFSTDVLVGFPGEEEEDFRHTVEILRNLSPLRVHIFPYSPRPDTPAFTFSPRVSSRVVWERKKRLSQEVREITSGVLKAQIGKKFQVLWERERNGIWMGYTENYIKCFLESKGKLGGQFCNVKIIGMDKKKLACYVKPLSA